MSAGQDERNMFYQRMRDAATASTPIPVISGSAASMWRSYHGTAYTGEVDHRHDRARQYAVCGVSRGPPRNKLRTSVGIRGLTHLWRAPGRG